MTRTQLRFGAIVATTIAAISCVAPLAAEETKTGEEPKIERRSAATCVGLDIHTCKTKGECLWRKQRASRFGDIRRPHCRMRPYERVAKKSA